MASVKFVLSMIATVVFAVIMKKLATVWDVFRSPVIAVHAPGPCIRLEGAEGGSEDLTALPDGRVFISSGVISSEKGKILLMDFLDPTHKIKELQLQSDQNMSDAHYHGLSVWQDNEKGGLTLAVIMHHSSGEDTVEMFKFDEKKQILIHSKTVRDPLFYELNDLVLVSENQFYVTCSLKWSPLELFLHLRFGEVLFYDGSRVRVAAGGHIFANGINISPDHRLVYVAELLEKDILVYERQGDNSLVLKQTKYVDSGVDNIEVDPKSGDLWVGAHPRIGTLIYFMHREGQGALSPSQVLKIKTEKGMLRDVIEVFLDDGGEIPASSVATVYKNRMVIGSVTSNPLLCDIKYSK